MRSWLGRAAPLVLPFITFLAAFIWRPPLGLVEPWDSLVRLGIVVAVIVLVSRRALPYSAPSWLASIGVGVVVFGVWVLPDLLWSDYRASGLFQNDVVGRVASSVPESHRGDPLLVGLRLLRAVVIVPIVEEFFWRGWLPRWVIDPGVESVPLGHFTPWAFMATAVLFAAEHGSFWDVGLVAGLIYNWWMWRTKSLGDLMIAHAVTNALLAGFVLLTGRWEYL